MVKYVTFNHCNMSSNLIALIKIYYNILFVLSKCIDIWGLACLLTS